MPGAIIFVTGRRMRVNSSESAARQPTCARRENHPTLQSDRAGVDRRWPYSSRKDHFGQMPKVQPRCTQTFCIDALDRSRGSVLRFDERCSKRCVQIASKF
jgi:hypothetical protein